MLLQDPRRYFEQPMERDPGGVSTSMAGAQEGSSVVDVLRSINPHAMDSGMTPAAARQVQSSP